MQLIMCYDRGYLLVYPHAGAGREEGSTNVIGKRERRGEERRG